MTLGSGIEPGPHWWEASTLTTPPSLLPITGSRDGAVAQAHHPGTPLTNTILKPRVHTFGVNAYLYILKCLKYL